MLFLPLAVCLSDAQVAAIRAFAEAGGTVIADGRVGILTRNGVIRDQRPLDDLFGVRSPAGHAAFAQKPQTVQISLDGQTLSTDVLEPSLTLAGEKLPRGRGQCRLG